MKEFNPQRTGELVDFKEEEAMKKRNIKPHVYADNPDGKGELKTACQQLSDQSSNVTKRK